jgi:hypothetical protein
MPLPNWWFCKPEYADWLGVLPNVLPAATGLPFQAIVYSGTDRVRVTDRRRLSWERGAIAVKSESAIACYGPST